LKWIGKANDVSSDAEDVFQYLQALDQKSDGIHERLREVSGKLDISSSSDGTILRVSLPVTNIREAHRNFAASGR